MRRAARLGAVTLLVAVTVVLQVSVFDELTIRGVVPDLAMLVVIAGALVRGPGYGAVIGFCTGLLIDLVPPADHVAGRWALALVLVGYVTGLVRTEGRPGRGATVLAVAGGVFVGTSLYALSGLVLGAPGASVSDALRVIPLAVLYDVLVTPLVVPLALVAFRHLDSPPRW